MIRVQRMLKADDVSNYLCYEGPNESHGVVFLQRQEYVSTAILRESKGIDKLARPINDSRFLSARE